MPKTVLRALAAVGAAAAMPATSAVSSQGGTNPIVTVVMSGLDSPRGLTFGPEGALYVAEAGRHAREHLSVIPSDSPQMFFIDQACISRWPSGLTARST